MRLSHHIQVKRRTTRLEIEVLYVEDCPSYQECHARIKRVLKKEEIDAKVKLRMVTSFSEAEDLKFPGSPTIRINGKDFDPEGTARGQYGLVCRIYKEGDKKLPMPSERSLRRAILNANK
jgi:hypothetical protein